MLRVSGYPLGTDSGRLNLDTKWTPFQFRPLQPGVNGLGLKSEGSDHRLVDLPERLVVARYGQGPDWPSLSAPGVFGASWLSPGVARPGTG